MKKHRWIRIIGTEGSLADGLTWLLVSQRDVNLIPEWQPGAQVTYRQVYETQNPAWYVWTFSGDHIDMKDRAFPSMETAMEFVEQYFGVAGQTEVIR